MILTLEDQVCSLELAKRLKGLGARQVTIIKYWHENPYVGLHGPAGDRIYPAFCPPSVGLHREICAAYTVAELGAMLPNGSSSVLAGCAGWCAELVEPYDDELEPNVTPYPVDGFKLIHREEEHDTEADARASLLIHLIEQGLVSFQKGATA